MQSAKVLLSKIRCGKIESTNTRNFDNYRLAREFVRDTDTSGYVGCIKVGDKIKNVF